MKFLSLPRMVLFLVFAFLVFSTIAPSEHAHLCDGFLPHNDLQIPVREWEGLGVNRGGVSEAKYNEVLDKVAKLISPMVSNRGGRLVIRRLWSDSEVNAYASREGTNFIIAMHGGLARHHTMTADGLALVACHEVGHHIAGTPKYNGRWASVEGESDYFASLKCLRYLWENDNNVDVINQMNVDQTARRKCEEQFSDENEAALCMRSSMAGLSGARLFAALSGGADPRFDTPDSSQVGQTYESHPAYQCRLDTYYQGAVCERGFREPWSDSDPNVGACNRDSGDSDGLRPLCWYRPQNGGGNPGPGPSPDPNPNPGTRPPTPTLNGQLTLRWNNPNQAIQILLDGRSIPGVGGVLMEISKPNQDFRNPGGNAPDPVGGLGFQAFRGAGGTFALLPRQHLPSWGRYKIRVLALDAQGKALGNFSDSAVLDLRP